MLQLGTSTILFGTTYCLDWSCFYLLILDLIPMLLEFDHDRYLADIWMVVDVTCVSSCLIELEVESGDISMELKNT